MLAPNRASLTFERLAMHLDETRARLRTAGIGAGDRVAAVLPDGPDAAAAAIAISSSATFAPLNPTASRIEYESVLLALAPKAVLLHPGATHSARDAARSLRIPVLEVHRHFDAGVFTLDGRTGYAPAPDRIATPDDLAVILCARGAAKLVPAKLTPWTHANIAAGISSIAREFELSELDRCLNLSPLFDWRGLMEGLFVPLFTGGSVICGAPCDAGTIQRFQPTWISGLADGIPEGLRRIPRLHGMPESPAIAVEGRLCTDAAERDGEIVVRGPSVISAYFRSEAATRDAFRDGWFRTGDTGHIDQDGRIAVTGRRREFIDRGGSGILPVEIDEVLLSHPAVARAIAFPIPGMAHAEEIAAAVELHAGASLSAEALRGFAATHLAGHKLPRRIFVLAAIPDVDRFEMADALGIHLSSEPAAVFPIEPAGSGIPLFVVASREAGSRNLARFLGMNRPVFGISEPDLEQLGRPHTIEHIAAECVRALRRFRPEGPYALGGWHADGIVAIEMGRQLEAEGEEIAFVALVDTPNLWGHRLSRARRFLARSWQHVQRRFQSARMANNAAVEGLRFYRFYPWSGRVLRFDAAARPELNSIVAGELDRVG